MDLNELKLKLVLFYMQSFVLDINGYQFEVPRTMIGNIQIHKRFDLEIFPMWYVAIQVPLWIYNKMTNAPDNITVTMKLQYMLGNDREKMLQGNGTFLTDVSGKFKVVIPYSSQLSDNEIQSGIEKADGATNKAYSYNTNLVIEIALYNLEAYKAAFDMVGSVLPRTTPTSALIYLINKAGLKNILFTKADNNKVYPEFKILPQSTIENITRICDEIGVHDDGSVIYYDLPYSYIITKKIGCYVWRNNEHKTVYIQTTKHFSGTLGEFTGIHIDNEKKISVLAIANNQFKATTLEFTKEIKSAGATKHVQVTTGNALLNILTPNKEFIFSCDDLSANKYNGKYRLNSVDCTLVPAGEFLDPAFSFALVG